MLKAFRKESLAGEPSQSSGIRSVLAQSLAGRSGRDRLQIGALLGAEAQQSGNIADLVELRRIFHIEHFNIAADNPGQNRFSDVDDFAGGLAADWAEADEVGIEMPAAGTLDCMGEKVFSDQHSLDFAQFKRPQHTAQSGDAAGIAA